MFRYTDNEIPISPLMEDPDNTILIEYPHDLFFIICPEKKAGFEQGILFFR